MGFGEAVKLCFLDCVNFRRRARRSEFWYIYLFLCIVNFGIYLFRLPFYFTNLIDNGSIDPLVFKIVDIFCVIVFQFFILAPSVRRFHDVNKVGVLAYITLFTYNISPWCKTFFDDYDRHDNSASLLMALTLIGLYLVMCLAIIALAIYILVVFIKDSDPGVNNYGPSPKIKLIGYDSNGNPIFGDPEKERIKAIQENQMRMQQMMMQQYASNQAMQPQMMPQQPVNSQMQPQMQPQTQAMQQPQMQPMSVQQLTNTNATLDPEKQHFDSSVYQEEGSMWQ